MMCSPSVIPHTHAHTHTYLEQSNQASKKRKKVCNLPNGRGEPLLHQSTFSPNSKRLHYRRFPPGDQSNKPTTIAAHLPDLHVSLIMVPVYSLEDQRPTEMAGCVIKSLTLGAPKM